MIRSANQCAGKLPYTNRETANKSALSLNKHGGKRMTTYKCPACGSFHIGHNGKGNKLNPKTDMKRRKIIYVHEPGVHKVENRFKEDLQ